MKLNTSILFSGLLLSSTSAFSGGVALTENDCLDLLEKWAADPNSVPAHLVNHCRDMMTAGGQRNPAGIPVNSAGIPIIEPAAGRPGSDSNRDAMGATDPATFSADDGADMHKAGTPISLADDPCSGSSAAGSVYCWGPWTSLAPAAGPVVAAADQVRSADPFIERPETLYPDPELNPDEIDGPPVADLPLGSCQPGQSCGFATLVVGTTTRGDSEDTKLVPFDLEQDGSQFIVDADGPDEIISNDNMEARYRTDPFGQERMLSEGTIGDVESKLQARVFRDDNGDNLQSADFWKHGDIIRPDTNTSFNGNSGGYAWGITSSQATLDALNNGGQGISATFSGLMVLDTQNTAAMMTVNFGSQPTWTGEWVNPGYNFTAGGNLTGADLISDPNQFSSNVQDNSYVQGVLLGESGDQSVAHAIDVNLDIVGNVKDVGLLKAAQ